MASNASFMQFVPLLIIMVIFYFLLIRPQQKQMKERKTMLENVKGGDRILTTGGVIGVIVSVREEEMEVEIAKGVRVAMVKSAVASVLNPK